MTMTMAMAMAVTMGSCGGGGGLSEDSSGIPLTALAGLCRGKKGKRNAVWVRVKAGHQLFSDLTQIEVQERTEE